MRLRNRSSGFTLIELMIVLALVAIVATVAVPGFSQLIASNRQTTLTNSLVGLLHYARSEAVRRGESIEVTPSGGSFVVTSPPGGAGTTLREIESIPSGATIERIDVGGGDLIFRASGRSDVAGAAFTYRVCGALGSEGTVVSVNRGGQISTNSTTATCSNK